jgi:hypothetical protein
MERIFRESMRIMVALVGRSVSRALRLFSVSGGAGVMEPEGGPLLQHAKDGYWDWPAFV